MGADYIEQDLQLTKGGVLVVLHDDTLNRTARGLEVLPPALLRSEVGRLIARTVQPL